MVKMKGLLLEKKYKLRLYRFQKHLKRQFLCFPIFLIRLTQPTSSLRVLICVYFALLKPIT